MSNLSSVWSSFRLRPPDARGVTVSGGLITGCHAAFVRVAPWLNLAPFTPSSRERNHQNGKTKPGKNPGVKKNPRLKRFSKRSSRRSKRLNGKRFSKRSSKRSKRLNGKRFSKRSSKRAKRRFKDPRLKPPRKPGLTLVRKLGWVL